MTKWYYKDRERYWAGRILLFACFLAIFPAFSAYATNDSDEGSSKAQTGNSVRTSDRVPTQPQRSVDNDKPAGQKQNDNPEARVKKPAGKSSTESRSKIDYRSQRVDRTSQDVNRTMRSLNNTIRNMNTQINRIRNLDRRLRTLPRR